jgi:hypothetical protein
MSIDLLPQTPSVSLARLGMEASGFCLSYLPTLEEIERSSPDGLIPLLDHAADERLFASIYAIDRSLEEAFSQTILALGEGLERWRFAVAFATRTIIDRDPLERIDEDLKGIFYGEGRSSPPIGLPDTVDEAMAGLISLSGRSLTEYEADQARYLAGYIEYYFVFDVLP